MKKWMVFFCFATHTMFAPHEPSDEELIKSFLLSELYVEPKKAEPKGEPGRFSVIDESKGTFSDYAGAIPEQIRVLLDMIKHPEQFEKFGIEPSKGILLVGPPGTGKTLLARYLASQSGCGFIPTNASDFIEVYVGTGAARIRELFTMAREWSRKNKKRVIIFIDEIDALGYNRDRMGTDTEGVRSCTALLAEMDGFTKDDRVIILGATNVPDQLDNAFKRPGRFDTIIEVPLPDKKARKEVLSHYLNKIDVQHRSSAISPDHLADLCDGFNNADIKEVVRRACILAVMEHSTRLLQAHLELSITEIRKQKDISSFTQRK